MRRRLLLSLARASRTGAALRTFPAGERKLRAECSLPFHYQQSGRSRRARPQFMDGPHPSPPLSGQIARGHGRESGVQARDLETVRRPGPQLVRPSELAVAKTLLGKTQRPAKSVARLLLKTLK